MNPWRRLQTAHAPVPTLYSTLARRVQTDLRHIAVTSEFVGFCCWSKGLR